MKNIIFVAMLSAAAAASAQETPPIEDSLINRCLVESKGNVFRCAASLAAASGTKNFDIYATRGPNVGQTGFDVLIGTPADPSSIWRCWESQEHQQSICELSACTGPFAVCCQLPNHFPKCTW